MNEDRAKKILWCITGIIFLFTIVFFFSPYKVWGIPLVMLLFLSCPKIDEIINKITKATMTFYFEKLRMMVTFISPILIIFVVAFVVAFFSSSDISESKEILIFETTLKIVFYSAYVIVAFMYHRENKKVKYSFFGLFYFLCIVISYIPLDMFLGESNTVILFVDDILMPIKEAMLTYIIFDTAFDSNIRNIKKEEKKCNQFDVIVEGNDDNKYKKEFLINIENIVIKSNQPPND